MLFPGLPTTWVLLDVSNLAKDWIKWKQSFEVLIVAACDEESLRDRQKLAIFLHCLGRDGRDIVNGWYPQLINFNTAAAKETTFAEVWNRMNAHCQSQKLSLGTNNSSTPPEMQSDIAEVEDISPMALFKKHITNQIEMLEKRIQRDKENEQQSEKPEDKQATMPGIEQEAVKEEHLQDLDGKEPGEKDKKPEDLIQDDPETITKQERAEEKLKVKETQAVQPTSMRWGDEIDVDTYKKEMMLKCGSSDLTLHDLGMSIVAVPDNEWTVREYLTRGNQLTINDKGITDLPLERFRFNYYMWGRRTSNLKILGGPVVNSLAEFPKGFENLSELTLSSVEWRDESIDLGEFPDSLRKLHVKDCHIVCLPLMLDISQDTLQSIHLEGLKIKRPFDFASNPNFQSLKSLTLIGKMKIEGLRQACPVLEYLRIEIPSSDVNLHTHIPNNVTTLIMRWPYKGIYGLNYLKYFQNLQYLEIREKIDQYYFDVLQSLKLKTLKVTYKLEP